MGATLPVEIVTIGTELLLGFTVDTNSAFIGRTLATVGVRIARRTAVSAIAIFKIQITYRAHPVYFITILNILEVILNTLLVKEATKR